MKIPRNTFSLFLVCTAILLSAQSCSDSSNNDIPEEIIPDIDKDGTENEISDASLDIVSKSWGYDVNAVKKEQHKGLKLVEEDDNFIKYSPKNESFQISYDFIDNKLRAALLLVPVNSTANAGHYKMTGYKYLGNIDGAAVYVSADNTSMGTIINRTIDSHNYLAIGFTPLESELFETIEPITVTTLPAKNITKNSMTVCGEYTGTTEAPKAIISCSLNQDMSNSSKYTCTIKDGKFEYNLNYLSTNAVIYYIASVTDEGIVYEGSVECAEVEKQITYNIGDIYPNSDNPEGVVCYISNGGANGTIVSLDEEYMKWDLNGIFCTRYYCRSTTNGSLNDMGTTNPYAKWVKGHGPGWYGPARGELLISKDNLTKINNGLRQAGGEILDGFYWSSSEYDANIAWVTTVTPTSHMGYNNGHYFYNSKNNNHSVRAMKNF